MSTTEFETKVLDIDTIEIEKKLIWLGAQSYPEVLMRRWVFDMKDKNTRWNDVLAEWFRLRDEWNWETKLTYKTRASKEIWNTQEIEIAVDSFENCYEMLNKLIRKWKYYQENRRKKIFLNEVEFTIDSRPMIPQYLEIEWKNIESVRKWIEILWLEWKEFWDQPTSNVYKKYWIDLHNFETLKF